MCRVKHTLKRTHYCVIRIKVGGELVTRIKSEAAVKRPTWLSYHVSCDLNLLVNFIERLAISLHDIQLTVGETPTAVTTKSKNGFPISFQCELLAPTSFLCHVVLSSKTKESTCVCWHHPCKRDVSHVATMGVILRYVWAKC